MKHFKSAKKLIVLSLFMLAIPLLILTIFRATPATALSGAEFQAGRIIDDGVFFNPNTMSPQDIQYFLNIKVPSCDTNGDKIYSGSTTRRDYSISQGYPPPYTCLKDYSMSTPSEPAENLLCKTYNGGTKSAAQIIYDVSVACDINPQVLLVLLQKEQSLVTDDWPWPVEYQKATGYGCPDTALCDSQYYGFFNQVYNAARIYKKYARDASQYNFQAGRNNNILYNPNTACGSSSVYISNQATAGLYIYTPYQPNQAALNNLYGSGDGCSAYGNRNFWRLFNDWFGSTQTSIPYAWSVAGQQMFADAARTQPLTGTSINVGPGGKVYVRITARNMGYQIWDGTKIFLGTARAQDRSSIFADASWTSPARIGMKEASVVPGQTATFEASFTAPTTPGLYNEYFNVLAEGVTWMNDPGLYYSINVLNKLSPSNTTNTGLPSGASVTPGQYLLSPDTQSRLNILGTGELVLFHSFGRAWSDNAAGHAIKGLYMQTDGNLVLYDTMDKPIWQTGTSNNPGAHLELQTDGNMVLYSSQGAPLWASGTIDVPDNLSRVNLTLYTAELYPGQFLMTPDGKHKLALQLDGNLVIYSQNQPVWNTATNGQQVSMLSMQPDGNLVLYSKSGQALWRSNTAGVGPSALTMQPDGNLVLYATKGAVWNSGTVNR